MKNKSKTFYSYVFKNLIYTFYILNRFFVKEVYPNDRPKLRLNPPSEIELIEIFKTAKPSMNLKKFIFSNFPICLG